MKTWDSNRKGLVAEKAIEVAAIKLGVDVYLPGSASSRADMLFDLGHRILRIQCKWGRLAEDLSTLLVHTSGFRLT